MKTVHKHEIPIDAEHVDVNLPDDAKILSIEYMIGARSISMWTEVAADLNASKKQRKFKVFKTGDGIPVKYQHIGTAVDQHLPEAYHLYEMLTD